MPFTCRRLLSALAGGAALAAALSACGSSSAAPAAGGSPSTSPSYAGLPLAKLIAEPPIVLTDATGHRFDLRARTAGTLTVVYVGYTNCPDVCPTTLADLNRALQKLTPAQAKKVSVVFITSDPKRDTPAVLHRYLAQFNPSFIGLTGNLRTIQAYAQQMGVLLQDPEVVGGKVSVAHGAQVIAFSPGDQMAHLVWLPPTAIADYAHDMRILLASG